MPRRSDPPIRHRDWRRASRQCLIDLADPLVRADAIRSGLVWFGPVLAQQEAVRDIILGRVREPAVMPEWAANSIAWFRDHPEAIEAIR